MNTVTKTLAASVLLGMSMSSQAASVNADLMSDISNLLVSSIQESIQKMSTDAKANLKSAVKKQLDEVATSTNTQPESTEKEEK